MIVAGVFTDVSDAFPAGAPVQYTPTGSEAVVFRDLEAPEKAAGEIVSAVRVTLGERVRSQLGDTKLWDQSLHGIKPTPRRGGKIDASIDDN
jgi:hypothetical protein